MAAHIPSGDCNGSQPWLWIRIASGALQRAAHAPLAETLTKSLHPEISAEAHHIIPALPFSLPVTLHHSKPHCGEHLQMGLHACPESFP